MSQDAQELPDSFVVEPPELESLHPSPRHRAAKQPLPIEHMSLGHRPVSQLNALARATRHRHARLCNAGDPIQPKYRLPRRLPAASPITPRHQEGRMSTIKTKDGTEIYYKDWGEGPVVTFSHGWPLNGDAWESQLFFLAQNGFRAIAHDRRGHGRSSQPSSGNDMNTYADDLAQLIETLGV